MSIPFVVPIIVIQTSTPAYEACMRELAATELEAADDYVLIRWPEVAETAIIAGERQMLVTGSFSGDQEEADEFVRRMKEKNPQLRRALFSSFSPTGGIGPAPYDITIQRGVGGASCEHLITEMRTFLAGGK
ncbi:MAG TPA: hypothetical protein VJC13_01580 [Candidatus Paceibacterota bacterium]